MAGNHPTAFVSYSWDNIEHERWVLNLVNRLRAEGGVEAICDKFYFQEGTVNVNKMMISGIRDSDYIIVVLTEKYAVKADAQQGGVGYESILTIPVLKENKDKVILIMRHKGDYSNVFPFHLRDYYAIDFSKDGMEDFKFKELLYRIFKTDLYYKAPLGPIPNLKQRLDSIQKEETPLLKISNIERKDISSARIVNPKENDRNKLCPCGSGKKFIKCCGME